MSDCSICCETFNKSTRCKITCSACQAETCRTCVSTYLLNIVTDPHCMSCKHPWDREFLSENCTNKFVNGDLKKHRENILIEREKALLPQTQDAANREIQKRNITKLIEDARREIERQRSLIDDLCNQHRIINNGGTVHDINNEKKIVYTHKCPMTDCRGFLDEKWTCKMCETLICKKCNEKVVEGHICNEDHVKSMELLKKDTKPCPTCSTYIHKISGCDQMWCPSCRTAFSWRTGRIETGIIHNPHYYEFNRLHGNQRNHADIPCGGMPTLNELRFFLERNYDSTSPVYRAIFQKLGGYHRLVLHIQGYTLRYVYGENEVDNSDLRVQYLLKEISDEHFKKVIQQREKKHAKNIDIRLVLQMYVDVCSDLFRQYVNREIISHEDLINQIIQIRNYCNTVLDKIRKRYNNKTPYFSTVGSAFID